MSNEQSSTQNLFSRSTTPNPFSPDWHHHYGARLSAFPRYLVVPLQSGRAQFWPDLATFVEGPRWTALMYYPGPSRLSACVVHWPDAGLWEAFLFDDERTVARLCGSSYAELIEELSN